MSGFSSQPRFHRALILASTLLATPIMAVGQTPVPTFQKKFNPNAIGPGGVSTLRFDITNPSSAAVQKLAFTDTLPAGMTIASPANATSTCQGSLSALSGENAIIFGDGGIGASRTCSIAVDVTSSTPGRNTNVSGDLTSDAGNSGSATADLLVATDRPGFGKAFSPPAVAFGGRSTLTLTLDNTANPAVAANLTFTDNLPPGMAIASPAAAVNNCIGGVISAPAGGSVITLAGASVAAGASCTVAVDVIGGAVGLLGNTTGELTSTSSSGQVRSSGKASATLTVGVVDRISFTKSFTDDPVSPGGTVNLEFVIRNLSRSFSATDIAFDDDLDAVLLGLGAISLPPDPCGPGSTLTGTSVLSLSRGSLGPEGTCTFRVPLQVPWEAPSGQYANTTSPITANVGGAVTGDPASDRLFVTAALSLAKRFIGDPVGAGGSVSLEFTVTSPTSPASDIAFIDELTTFLPFPVSVTLPSAPCGAGSSLSLISLGTDRQGLALTDGQLGAGASCSFTVGVDIPAAMPAGVYRNATGEITATVDGETVTGNPATDDLVIVGGVRLTKEFTDDPVAPGDTVTLEFTLSHDETAAGNATAIAFTDDLDAALSGLVATGLPLADVCGTGSEIDGTMTLTFAGGTLAPGESCTFSVTLDVPATATAGRHTNTTSSVVATVLGVTATDNAASDDLAIAGLTLAKEFTDDPVFPGGTATLQFTVENTSPFSVATDIVFQDDLDDALAGLAVDPTSVPTVPCGAGSEILLLAGDTFLTLQGGTLGSGETCTFSVTLQVPAGAAAGSYVNRTSSFRATIDGSTVVFDNATDLLTVETDALVLTKEFVGDPVRPGDSVALRFKLTNVNDSLPAMDLAFTDDLDAALEGLVSVSGTPADVCGIGSQITGTDLLTFTGGSLAAGASCTFDLTLAVPPAAPLGTVATNTTSGVTGTIDGFAVTGAPATDTLRISFLTFTKSFGGEPRAGDTVELTFTLRNLSTSDSVTDLSFSDDLDAVIPGLTAVGLPVFDVCGEGSVLDGGSSLTFSGGALLPGGSCTFSVELQVPATAASGNHSNTTSDLFQQGIPVADPANATLTVMEQVADADDDGVLDDVDLCPGTEIPEAVPTRRLLPFRYALVDDDTIFDTRAPFGFGFPDRPTFTTAGTAGCSCDQIVDELRLPGAAGRVQRWFGCSLLVMKVWTRRVGPERSGDGIDHDWWTGPADVAPAAAGGAGLEAKTQPHGRGEHGRHD